MGELREFFKHEVTLDGVRSKRQRRVLTSIVSQACAWSPCQWKSGHWLTVGVCLHVCGGLCVSMGARPSMSGKLFPSYINSPESKDGVLALLFLVGGGGWTMEGVQEELGSRAD